MRLERSDNAVERAEGGADDVHVEACDGCDARRGVGPVCGELNALLGDERLEHVGAAERVQEALCGDRRA